MKAALVWLRQHLLVLLTVVATFSVPALAEMERLDGILTGAPSSLSEEGPIVLAIMQSVSQKDDGTDCYAPSLSWVPSPALKCELVTETYDFAIATLLNPLGLFPNKTGPPLA